MRLEWDARKGRENLRKHGVSFEEASSVFLDRKSTRLNSSHSQISYGAFCLTEKTLREDGVDRFCWPIAVADVAFAIRHGPVRIGSAPRRYRPPASLVSATHRHPI